MDGNWKQSRTNSDQRILKQGTKEGTRNLYQEQELLTSIYHLHVKNVCAEALH